MPPSKALPILLLARTSNETKQPFPPRLSSSTMMLHSKLTSTLVVFMCGEFHLADMYMSPCPFPDNDRLQLFSRLLSPRLLFLASKGDQ